MEKKTKKNLTIFAATAGVFGIIFSIIRFIVKREKKEVVFKGKKKWLYPQDIILDKTLLKLIPNFIKPIHISSFRIALTPLAALLIAEGPSLAIPLIVYLLVSFTDMIDGSMARTRDQITDLGKIVDPVADKLLFFFCALFLLPKLESTDLLLLMAGTEALALILAGLFLRSGRDIAANIFGKIKMNLQVIGIVLYLIARYESDDRFREVGEIILYLSIVFNILSTVMFFFRKKSLQNLPMSTK